MAIPLRQVPEAYLSPGWIQAPLARLHAYKLEGGGHLVQEMYW